MALRICSRVAPRFVPSGASRTELVLVSTDRSTVFVVALTTFRSCPGNHEARRIACPPLPRTNERLDNAQNDETFSSPSRLQLQHGLMDLRTLRRRLASLALSASLQRRPTLCRAHAKINEMNLADSEALG